MGASTGHTAVALWRDGSLQVGVSSLKFNQSVSTDLRVKCLLAILANQWNSMQPILGLAWGGETMDNANQPTLLTQFGRLAGYNTVWAPLRLRLKISFFQNLISALRGVVRWMLPQPGISLTPWWGLTMDTRFALIFCLKGLLYKWFTLLLYFRWF